jgi:hypothetical protein
MAELSAVVKLRPARIALLVSPGDKASIINFMRVSACMWGGVYNPIIPVFHKQPKAWAAEFVGDVSGLDVARGYIQFFEPDAFVEAQPGLLEKVGLGSLRAYISSRNVLTLNKLLAAEPHRDWDDLHLGLPVTDCLKELYQTEQRFQQRDPSGAMKVSMPPRSGLAEAMFGVYPMAAGAQHFSRTYDDVYRPEELPSSSESWKRVLIEGLQTPLGVTAHGIKPLRPWTNETKLFVFDPHQLTDLIDLWNLRSEPNPLIPMPVGWLPDLLPEVHHVIAKEYRPLQGNPNGIMRSAILEFSRGVDVPSRRSILDLLHPGLPAAKDGQGSLSIKHWRDRIWDKLGKGMMSPPKRITLGVDEKHITLEIKETATNRSTRYAPLRPSFASAFDASQLRWINSLRVSNYEQTDIATVYPYNTFDRSIPRLSAGGKGVLIGTEGWSFGYQYYGTHEHLRFESQETAILRFLERTGMQAELSEPGHIAKQIIHQLGGLWGISRIADLETLNMMNDMAGGIRRRVNGVDELEEQFDPRSRSISDWVKVINRRNATSSQRVAIGDFIKSNILVLGLETKCTNCLNRNWDAVDGLSYSLKCKRCLKTYPFPQETKPNERTWAYRVTGPFSVQDYAKGAYGSVLALRAISELSYSLRSVNFVTAVNMKLHDRNFEADYVAFQQSAVFDDDYEPVLILGEAKSFGAGELVKKKDIERLKELALHFPGSYLAVSVLRDSFTEAEKALLRSLVRWSRKLTPEGGPRNRVLLLTGLELLKHKGSVNITWQEMGGRHVEFSDFHNTDSLRNIAEATIAIHLTMSSFESERYAKWNKRKRRDPTDFPRMPGQWGRMLQTMSGPKGQKSTKPDPKKP